MKVQLVVAVMGMITISAYGSGAAVSDEARCNFGLYDLDDGRSLVIVGHPSGRGNLRYVLVNGSAATLTPARNGTYVAGDVKPYAELSFEGCAGPGVAFNAAGEIAVGQRRALEIRETLFQSDDIKLFGRLVLPANVAPRALVVWVEGSGNLQSIDYNYWQYLLAAQDIAVFVHDKRGTGRSKGSRTANFYLRANDSIAAMAEARRLIGVDGIPTGYFGGSAGVWVAPLAASRSDPDFVIAAYGLAEGATGEDREEVADDLKRAGYEAEELAKARRLTDAAAVIVRSGWKEGWDEFAALKGTIRMSRGWL